MIARIRRLSPHILTAGAVLLVAGLAWSLVRGQLELPAEIALAAGLVAVAAFVALEPGQVRTALTGRTARQGGNALVVTLSVIGILVLLNVLAARHNKRFDLTAERAYSLSPQTLQVLGDLQGPVDVTAFMTPGYFARATVEDLLREYTYHSDKIRLEIVDLEQNPALARQNNITNDGTIVFQAGDRRQTSLGYDEQAFTSALVKVTREEVKTVYFLTGHKERDVEDVTNPGYSTIAEAIRNDNYQVSSVNLSITPTVPSDAAVLIIAAPTISPAAKEIEAINAYVDRGGSLFVLGDPSTEVDLADVLSRWGLSLRRDIAIDPQSAFFGDVATPVISRYPAYHDITKDLTGLMTLYPLACSIATQSPAPDGVSVTPLVQTSAGSWGETDLQAQQVGMDEGQDVAGPLDLAVAATLDLPAEGEAAEEKHARLVLFGDADLVANNMLQSVQGTGNADLFLNATSWLAEEESLISIRAKQSTPRTVVLTPPQIRTVMYTSMIFLPGIVIAAGAWVWWRRR